MILRANCKINLGLDILRRRPDGFHDLETVMFPVAGLYDEVEITRTGVGEAAHGVSATARVDGAGGVSGITRVDGTTRAEGVGARFVPASDAAPIFGAAPTSGAVHIPDAGAVGMRGAASALSGADGVVFRCEGLAVDCPPEANICLRAFRLMQRRYGVDGVTIRLDKRVPFGAGLGGGSADGTAVLLGLDRLFGLNLPEEELIALAAELGSDTAFFVRNAPQLCKGRGEVMEPFALDLSGMTLVIVKPDDSVSTREAYAGVRPRVPETPLAERLRRPVAEWQRLITNDFEESVFAAHPAIRAAKERLLAEGAVFAAMSGSGSAVFGLFAGYEKSEKLRSLSPFVFGL